MATYHQMCDCGSGKLKIARYDGYKIFLCYACDNCWEQKIKTYRPDIMECYPCDEPIEPEEYY